MRYLFLIATLSVALSGCAHDMTIGASEDVSVLGTADLPIPTRFDATAPQRPYLIGPYDKLKIDVFGVDELAKEVQIDASGHIAFPLIGSVQAAGLTPTELAGDIAQRLRGRFVRDPQVTVNLLDAVSQVVTVDGQVNKPGIYPVVGRMTLMRTIANASGTTEYAKLDDVLIFRTVGTQQYVGLYNLGAIRRGNYNDPDIYANDVVIVGDSASKHLLETVRQVAPLISTPLILLLRSKL